MNAHTKVMITKMARDMSVSSLTQIADACETRADIILRFAKEAQSTLETITILSDEDAFRRLATACRDVIALQCND